MSDVRSIGMTVCILMVLTAYLKQVIPKGKTTYLMKSIVSVFIMLSVAAGIKSFNFQSLKRLLDEPYSHNEEVWQNAADLIGDGMKKEFQNYLSEEGVDAEVRSVSVEANAEQFTVRSVILSGGQAETARTLLAGRYQIGIAYIEVKNE